MQTRYNAEKCEEKQHRKIKNNKTVKNKSSKSTEIFREPSKCQREMCRESANAESQIDQNTDQRRTNI